MPRAQPKRAFSGQKDEAGAVLGGVPQGLDVGEGFGLDGEVKGFGGCGLKELGDGGHDLREGCAVEAAAEQFKAGAALVGVIPFRSSEKRDVVQGSSSETNVLVDSCYPTLGGKTRTRQGWGTYQPGSGYKVGGRHGAGARAQLAGFYNGRLSAGATGENCLYSPAPPLTH